MLYLSQLIKNKVVDSSEEIVGRLKDILIESKGSEYSPLVFLLLIDKQGKEFYIPYSHVETLSFTGISLSGLFKKFTTTRPKGDFIYLSKEVLDQQIVDVSGARVVRVNDLKLGIFEGRMCVLGIDISFKGILRRLSLAWLDFFDLLKVVLIDWRNTQLIKGKMLRLDTISQDLVKLHPADLANIIEDLTVKQGSKLVRSLDSDMAAQVLEEIEPDLQKMLVNDLEFNKLTKIVDKMSVDEVTDLVQMLNKEDAQKFKSLLQEHKLQKIEELIHYDEDTAGGLMTNDFLTGYPDWTLKKTIEEVKKVSHSMRSILYVYITDNEGRFLGSISLRKLLIGKPEQTLGEALKILPPSSTLRLRYKLKAILSIMTKYNLYTAAVLDDNDKLAGMVTIDDVLRSLFPNA